MNRLSKDQDGTIRTENIMRRPDVTEGGFTLVEIIVAVAILAIMSAALAPMVVKYVQDGRRARAASDSSTIAQSVIAFQLDVGRWPVSSDANPNDNGELVRLVGRASPVPDAGMPGACAGAPGGAGNWGTLGNNNTQGALEDLLIMNSDFNTAQLYPPSANPALNPGWNGPYVPMIPVDPWGNPYVVNARYFDGSGNVGAAVEATHAVFVLSAGQDGCWSTSFADGTALASNGLGGDDIGSLVEGNTQ